jgi:DNA helicase II / ATP-dependent DNA helicase PcrA
MVKPKTKSKKAPPADDDAEPTPPVVRTSAFSIGDAVHHPMFGDGKVEGIEGNKLTIAFEGQFTKVIREDFVTRKR